MDKSSKVRKEIDNKKKLINKEFDKKVNSAIESTVEAAFKKAKIPFTKEK
jgi:hypothetical protein